MFSQSYDTAAPFWHNGPSPGGFYNFPGVDRSSVNNFQQSNTAGAFGTQRSSQPITTGTSVVGIKFDEGVILAADNLVSYGSLARYQDVQRVFKINNKTIIGTGGDFADFQCIKRYIDQKIVEDICYDDKIEMKPKSLYNWLTRILYNKRSRFEPLWIDMVVGGLEDGVPFLGHIDLRGRSYTDDVIATGFGKHLALPLLREEFDAKGTINQQDASKLVRRCMEVLYYRDARALSKYTVVVCTKDGAVVQGPIDVSQNWEVAKLIDGY